MKKFSSNGTKKELLDVSEENVPFSIAYTVRTQKEIENFWEASYSISLWKDVPTEVDDLVVGVLWIRGRRTAESDSYDMDDPPDYYLAIKTPTDNWASEGSMKPQGRRSAGAEWEKVFFCGSVINEEPVTSVMSFNIYMGYGIQEFDIGGIIAYKFPWTSDNDRAVWKFID